MKIVISEMKGLEYDPNMTRRDPSPIIKFEDNYYVYYSKCPETSGYYASVWCAKSTDGITWQEVGEVIPKGSAGSFDSGACFTPTVFCADGYIYIIYTAVSDSFNPTCSEPTEFTCFGMAKCHSPTGPFEKLGDQPFFQTDKEGAFDSHRIDDSCIIHRNGLYYMYYKGRQIGKSPGETRMGVAISKTPEGPYVRYENNPIVDSGHEVCVYPTKDGVMALLTDTGPQGNTYQFSDDGINFRKMGDLIVPKSLGPYREDNFVDNAGFEFSWGVCHALIDRRPYLCRADVIY